MCELPPPPPKTLVKATLNHNSIWASSVDVLDREERCVEDDEASGGGKSHPLVNLVSQEETYSSDVRSSLSSFHYHDRHYHNVLAPTLPICVFSIS